MDSGKLIAAKSNFATAKTKHGDPDSVIFIAEGLRLLTESLMEMQKEITAIKAIVARK